jgi:hypothetical protein
MTPLTSLLKVVLKFQGPIHTESNTVHQYSHLGLPLALSSLNLTPFSYGTGPGLITLYLYLSPLATASSVTPTWLGGKGANFVLALRRPSSLCAGRSSGDKQRESITVSKRPAARRVEENEEPGLVWRHRGGSPKRVDAPTACNESVQ